MTTRTLPWIKLSVRFDVDQTSNQLHYKFKSSDDSARPKRGAHAGGVYFEQGQHMYIDVTATGPIRTDDSLRDAPFSSFQIIDCALISVPSLAQIGPDAPTRHSPPSPFLQSPGACYVLPLDFSSKVKLKEEQNVRRLRQKWKRTLNVAHTSGRWEISLYMTVMILRGATSLPELRVFTFDPETSVGGASGFGDPGPCAQV